MITKTQLTNFENIQDKFAHVVSSAEYHHLISLFQKHEEIYEIVNGRLHYVASHMATGYIKIGEF